ncbi:MAG: c-type cytochrome [Candidatus Rokuibacteriota bacterium]
MWGVRTGVGAVGSILLVVGLLLTALAQGKGDPKAGEAAYRKADCADCHGAAGAGDGAKGQKLKDKKPSNWTAGGGGGLKGMDDQAIFAAIAEGGKAVGKSKGMPAYPKLSDAEVWNLVAFVRTLGK